MQKILLIALTSLFMLTGATNTFAHTHLSSTTPEEGQVITEELTEISVTFDGQIEEGSSITLTTTTGEAVTIDRVTVADGVLTGTMATPLTTDNYTATWLAISADGHPVEGQFSFFVNLPVTETTLDTTPTVTEETQEANPETVEAETETETSSNTWTIVIALFAVIIIAVFFFLMKRKK